MAKRQRHKPISKDELRIVQERNWIPVLLAGEAIPSLFQGIPEETLMAVYASGTYWDTRMVMLGDAVVGNVVAGFDIFRYDAKDELHGRPINKDHYIVVMDSKGDDMYLILGPEKVDGDHWFNRLPETHPEIEIIDIPSNDPDASEYE